MLTQALLKELFYLDEEGHLRVNKSSKKKEKGELAGSLFEGYYYICIGRKRYPEHRLIWLWYTGEYYTGDLDHKDMNRANNRIENLRKVTRSQNMLNTRAHKDSRSKTKNIFYRKDTQKWLVRLSVNGRYRSFGCYDDLELAELVAIEAREKYHGEFARHA